MNAPTITPAQRSDAEPMRPSRRRAGGRRTSLFANGEPMVWLTGGALALALMMIVGLLALIIYQGARTFWPGPVVRIETIDGRVLAGEVTVTETYRPEEQVFESLPPTVRDAARQSVVERGGVAERRMLRTGNYELTGQHYQWVSDFQVRTETRPEWMLVVERFAWGRFYGEPVELLIDGQSDATGPERAWQRFEQLHDSVRERSQQRREIETVDIGKVNHTLESARLRLREVELESGQDSPRWIEMARELAGVEQSATREFERLQGEIGALKRENDRYEIALVTADGVKKSLKLEDIVRAYRANRLDTLGSLGVYGSRAAEFLTEDPREANSGGGVFPAIFGTVMMTLLMSVLVVPFGVLAALYLREYARPGPIVSAVRIAINNLAGVPSIVFGVFGLGFFCYIIGASIDELLFAAKLPSPTYGKGGLLWAALTLALLTLPVVIVPTEEALAAVPSSMREGSYACGATKWQTIRRIVLPRALPGIMTGMILALARGAGEVAPLMLVGAAKLAPTLPVDGTFPYVHPERSFMHLGFHIYDMSLQSQDSQGAKPIVYTTTLLLIGIVVLLNLVAVGFRARLRRRFQGTHI